MKQTNFDMDETPIISNEANSAKPEPPKRIGSLPLSKPLPEIPNERNAERYSIYDQRALPPPPRDNDSPTIDESPGMYRPISADAVYPCGMCSTYLFFESFQKRAMSTLPMKTQATKLLVSAYANKLTPIETEPARKRCTPI